MGCKSCFGAVLRGNWDLPITSCQVQSHGLPYTINEFIYPGHWIGITHGNLVESPVVHTSHKDLSVFTSTIGALHSLAASSIFPEIIFSSSSFTA